MLSSPTARYPFSLIVHIKNGSQLFLDRAIHLNGEWEMSITKLCIPKSQITLFRECFMSFNYNLQPKVPAKTERLPVECKTKETQFTLIEQIKNNKLDPMKARRILEDREEFLDSTLKNTKTTWA